MLVPNSQNQVDPNAAQTIAQNADPNQTQSGQILNNQLVQSPQNLMNDPNVARLIEQARNEEKQKLYSTLNKTKEGQKTLELELSKIKAEHEAASKKLKDQETSQLPGDEKLRRQISDMETQFAQTQKQLLDQVNNLAVQNRQQALQAYKEKRLREEAVNGPLFIENVGGQTEDEIENSIQASRHQYLQMQNQFYQQFLQEQNMRAEMLRNQSAQAQMQAPPGYLPQSQPINQTQAQTSPYLVRNGFAPSFVRPSSTVGYPPQGAQYVQSLPAQANPGYPPSVAPGFYPNQAPVPAPYYNQPVQGLPGQSMGGLPTAPAASSPIGTQAQHPLKDLTNEDAVRSGEYAKHRHEILTTIRQ